MKILEFFKRKPTAEEEAEREEARRQAIERLTETPETQRSPEIDARLKEPVQKKNNVISIEKDSLQNMTDQEVAAKIKAKHERIAEIQKEMGAGMERTPEDTRLIDKLTEEIIELESALSQRHPG